MWTGQEIGACWDGTCGFGNWRMSVSEERTRRLLGNVIRTHGFGRCRCSRKELVLSWLGGCVRCYMSFVVSKFEQETMHDPQDATRI